MASTDAAPPDPVAEVARQMTICNACRYCEGFCAVFPAMTRRLDFAAADVAQLANLCHSCGACLHACQYAPPHEFAVNVPQAMARARLQSWRVHAWPAPVAALYARSAVAMSVVLAACLALALAALPLAGGTLWATVPAGQGFYALVPHEVLVALFAPAAGFALLALGIGGWRFWRTVVPVTGDGARPGAPAAREAVHDVLTLKYLDGGHGDGCPVEDDANTHARRRFHHATMYGFALCFAATATGTVAHWLGHPAPYDLPALPKLLGAAGGVSLLAGTAGQAWLVVRRDPRHGDAAQRGMDLGFIVLLMLAAASGLALWLARATPAIGLLLCVHLGVVMALFVTLPFNRFAHGMYRGLALLRDAVEKRRPNPVAAATELPAQRPRAAVPPGPAAAFSATAAASPGPVRPSSPDTSGRPSARG